MKTTVLTKQFLSVLALCVLLLTIFFLVETPATEHLSSDETLTAGEVSTQIPIALRSAFPKTDWTRTDESVSKIISGGPGKDGIPAIDEPVFVPVSDFQRSDGIRAMVIEGGSEIKVYPYNILVWHEIVNDKIGGTPVSVTFCPLCGSAVVFIRSYTSGEITLGVSGWLIESNMVMYDRESETLWQQSTGRALAGAHLGGELELYPMQVLTMGEVKKNYPNALVLSESTGAIRDYARNPYAGYEEQNGYIFSPSSEDGRYPSKTIMVAFRAGGNSYAIPWLSIADGESVIDAKNIGKLLLRKENGELIIQNNSGEILPFYFEMWFSWIVQHKDSGTVIDPTK